jgi:hypothetical protein
VRDHPGVLPSTAVQLAAQIHSNVAILPCSQASLSKRLGGTPRNLEMARVVCSKLSRAGNRHSVISSGTSILALETPTASVSVRRNEKGTEKQWVKRHFVHPTWVFLKYMSVTIIPDSRSKTLHVVAC